MKLFFVEEERFTLCVPKWGIQGKHEIFNKLLLPRYVVCPTFLSRFGAKF